MVFLVWGGGEEESNKFGPNWEHMQVPPVNPRPLSEPKPSHLGESGTHSVVLGWPILLLLVEMVMLFLNRLSFFFLRVVFFHCIHPSSYHSIFVLV